MPVYKDTQRGTWFVSIYINGAKVTRRGFATRKDAQREEARLRMDKPTVRIKVVTLIDDYILYKKGRVKESTHHTYTDYVTNFIVPYFGEKYVSNIGYKEAEKFMDYLRDKGYSAHYCNNVFGFVRSAWKYGMRYHGIESNPFTLVERPKTGKKEEMKTWSPEEFLRFYKALTSKKARNMFLLMYWTGMRKGEMRGLQWKDVSWSDRTVSITKQYSRYGGLTPPKTDSAARKIDIPPLVYNELNAWYSVCQGIEGFADDWFVFGDKEPIGLNTIDWHWHKGIRDSGVPAIRIHDLRHSHASWLFANKFDTAYISHRLGHSSIAITMQVYTHLMNDVAQRERARLNSMTLF